MERTAHYEQYLQILREELIPAMGCTEPVAIALAAAKAREALGAVPERCRVEVSGNIIKNVKAVTVPNTGGLKGIEAAAAAGMAAGRPELELEVLSRITQEEIPSIHAMLDQCAIRVVPSTGDRVFFINVTVAAGEHTACCEIVDFHTNIVRIQKDEQILFRGGSTTRRAVESQLEKRGVKTVELLVDLRMQPEEPCRIEAQKRINAVALAENTTRRASCGGVDLELFRTRQGCILRMRVGGQRFITLSGTVQPAKPIRAEWLLASMARPDNIRYTDCLTLSSKYRWMEEDAEPVSRLRLRLEGGALFKAGRV